MSSNFLFGDLSSDHIYPPAATYICVLGWLLRAAACLLTKPSTKLSLVLKAYAGNVNGLSKIE